MINNVILVGRMTRDPELRTTGNNASVTTFTLALDRRYNSSDGQTADFINCVVWNKPAENVKTYCSKGSLVGVEGRLQSRSYDNAQGQKVYVTEVVCNSVQFLDTRNGKGNTQPSNQYQQNQNTTQYNQYQQQPQQQVARNNSFQAQPMNLQQEFDNSESSYVIGDEELPF